jgi:hypothetical protein
MCFPADQCTDKAANYVDYGKNQRKNDCKRKLNVAEQNKKQKA